MAAFGHSQRFQSHKKNGVPGPGAYHNHQKEIVRKSTSFMIQDWLKNHKRGSQKCLITQDPIISRLVQFLQFRRNQQQECMKNWLLEFLCCIKKSIKMHQLVQVLTMLVKN